ncbi:hypothetical protein [Streptomyces tanashiensis]|uniref:hypothetical protein n=1 Tax=Streptomyces tanashiensis TaxID=67367 RepID=UPI00167E3370|nr:hypothetical protein [Streptomyces tanashiensis]GGY18958.1 hypothetical protein GCM10010299_25880 [Streptomyces tanashiensis]
METLFRAALQRSGERHKILPVLGERLEVHRSVTGWNSDGMKSAKAKRPQQQVLLSLLAAITGPPSRIPFFPTCDKINELRHSVPAHSFCALLAESETDADKSERIRGMP